MPVTILEIVGDEAKAYLRALIVELAVNGLDCRRRTNLDIGVRDTVSRQQIVQLPVATEKEILRPERTDEIDFAVLE